MADDVQVRFGASIGELISGVDQVKESILSIAEPVLKVKEAIFGLGEAFAAAFGVEKVAEFYEKMAELGERTEVTMKIFGQSSREVGELGFVARETGVPVDTLTHAMERFSVGLQNARQGTGPVAEGLHALGLNAKDLVGLPLDTMLAKVADRISQFGDGLNKTAIAGALFGSKLGGQLIPVLDEGSKGFEELRQKADATGTVLTEDSVRALAGLEKQIIATKASIEGIGIAFAAASAGSIQSFLARIADLAEKFRLLTESGQFWRSELDGLRTALDSWSASLYNAGRIMADVIKLDWNKVVADWTEGTQVQERILEEHNVRVGTMLLAAKFKQQADLAKVPNDPRPDAPLLPQVDKAGAEAARAQIKQAETAYQITVDRLNSEVKLTQITEDQKAAAQRTAINTRTLAESAAYDQLLGIYKNDAAQYAKIQAEKTQMLMQATRDSLKVQQQQLETDVKQWQSALTPLQSAWDSQLRGLLAGTTTWAQAMKSIVADLILDIIKKLEALAVEKAALALASAVGSPKSLLNLSAISADTGQAFAGFAAFLAPTLGPGAIPAAEGLAATVAAQATAFAVPSLDIGGYVLSSGLANIHKGETIVPAQVNSPYGAGGGTASPNITIAPVVNAIDAAGVQRFLRQYMPQIARELQGHLTINPQYS